MAEGVRFELTRGVNPCRFSRPVLSTAQPTLQAAGTLIWEPRVSAPKDTRFPLEYASFVTIFLVDLFSAFSMLETKLGFSSL